MMNNNSKKEETKNQPEKISKPSIQKCLAKRGYGHLATLLSVLQVCQHIFTDIPH